MRSWIIFAAAGFLTALLGAFNTALNFFPSDAALGPAGALLIWVVVVLATGPLDFLELWLPPWVRNTDWVRQHDRDSRLDVDPREELLIRLAERTLRRRATLTRASLVVGIGAGIITIVDGLIDLVTKIM
jgi:hypothetical protein